MAPDTQTTDEPDSAELQRNSVGLSGTVGQSLSAMGLSGVIGTSVPVVAINAGAGGWLSWGIAALVILPVALSMSLLARRYATSGGLYGLTSKALGPLGGLVTGGLMVLMIGVAAGTGVLSFGVYFSQFLGEFDIGYSRWVLGVSSVACLALTWWLARVGAKPAAWVMFVTEILATIAMLVVFVAVLLTHDGPLIDQTQLHLQGSSFSLILAAVVLAVGGFGGFESAAVYGREAANPRRVIPIAMVMSSLIAGAVWMFAGYTLFLGFGSAQAVSNSSAPMGTLADIAGMDWYQPVVDLSLSFTIGASLIAVFSWVARFMYTMSTEGVAPKSWGRIHPKYKTPSAALAQAGVLWLALIVGMSIVSDNPLATFGEYIGDMSGYPLLLVYGLVCAGTIRYQWKQGRRFSVWVWLALAGILGMAYVLYDNLFPIPGFPLSLIVYLFVGLTAAICVAYLVLRSNRPAVVANIGGTVEDELSDKPPQVK